MNNIENLVIDSDPKVNTLKKTVETEFNIDSNQEIIIQIVLSRQNKTLTS